MDDLLKKIKDDLGVSSQRMKAAERIPDSLPLVLKRFYRITNGIVLPFGRIFPVEGVVRAAQAQPMEPDWIVFGQDPHFTFWLCRKTPWNGCSVTSWDHESRTEIGEPCWEEILDFLESEYEAYLENFEAVHETVSIRVRGLGETMSWGKVARLIQVSMVDRKDFGTVKKALNDLPLLVEVKPESALNLVGTLRANHVDVVLVEAR